MSRIAGQSAHRGRLGWTAPILLILLSSSRVHAQWPDLGSSDPVLMELDGSKDAVLIVSIEQYESLAKIPGARANAEAWSLFFRSSLNVPERNVVRLNDNDAKDAKIRSTLSDLVKRAKVGGRIWFVFIGHGAPSRRPGDGLLAGYDASATVEGLEQRSLHRTELLELLNKRAADKVTGVAILDASFSGKTEHGALVEGLLPAAALSHVVPARVLVMTAASNDEVAGSLADVSPQRPAFSYLMLGALRGWADENKDGRVTAREAVAYSSKSLQVDQVQHPSLDASDSDFVLSDGSEEPPRLEPRLSAEEDDANGFGPPMRAAAPARDDGEAERAFGTDEVAIVHGTGSVEVGFGGGAPYSSFVLFGEGTLGLRFGEYVRLTGLVQVAGSGFNDTSPASSNPSPRASFGVSGAAGLGLELARTRTLSMSADVLGGVTYLGERCENPVADGAGNLICDRVQASGIGPAGGVRLAMQVRVGGSEAQREAAAQGFLISGTALTSKPSGLFGGVFIGYGAW